MRFELTIDMDNSAFEDAPGELGRILRDVAATMDRSYLPQGARNPIRDINGNRVGEYRYTTGKES